MKINEKIEAKDFKKTEQGEKTKKKYPRNILEEKK